MNIQLLFLYFIVVISLSCGRVHKLSSDAEYLPVARVVDGDTFWVDDGSEKGLKVRLIGIDAPEPRNAFRKKEQPFGKEASAYMERLIGGREVRLEYDVGRLDRYGRTLAYAYLRDGTFVNARIVADGFATVMTVPPNVKYAGYFLKLERKARKSGRGLWKSGARQP